MPYAKLINGESWHLVTNGPVEFEKYLIQIQDFWKIINHLEEFLNWIKKYRKMSTYNQFILELIGSQPIMPKNLPRQYCHQSSAHSGPYWLWALPLTPTEVPCVSVVNH